MEQTSTTNNDIPAPAVPHGGKALLSRMYALLRQIKATRRALPQQTPPAPVAAPAKAQPPPRHPKADHQRRSARYEMQRHDLPV
eukprot:3934066-Rhodomonas_salina.1